jgi:hypothetical protein
LVPLINGPLDDTKDGDPRHLHIPGPNPVEAKNEQPGSIAGPKMVTSTPISNPNPNGLEAEILVDSFISLEGH